MTFAARAVIISVAALLTAILITVANWEGK